MRNAVKGAVVFTTEEVWSRYGYRLPLSQPQVCYVHSTDLAYLEDTFGRVKAEVIYGMGGGQAVDVAKWVGERCGARVVAVPTILSVDAPLVRSTAVRVDSRVTYLPTRAPDELVIFEDIILEAPPAYNAAGWGDVLSIYTAVWDWRLGHQRTGEPFDEQVAAAALALLETAVPPTTPAGLQALLAALKREVELCERVGNARPEEGSEHLFAYVIESRLPPGRKILHGELTGLGLVVMSGHQGQDPAYITRLLDRVGLRWRPEQLGIPPEVIAGVERDLPAQAELYQFPYSIANEMAGRQAGTATSPPPPTGTPPG